MLSCFSQWGRYDVKRAKQLSSNDARGKITSLIWGSAICCLVTAMQTVDTSLKILYFWNCCAGTTVCISEKSVKQKIDFVAEKPNDKVYIQVTESMQSPETRERELRPLRMIPDNYEKIVLSMDRSFINSYDGIKSVNLIDWLLRS